MFGYDWPHLHALLNDAPSALLVAAVLFDLLATLTRRPALRQAGFVTLLAGAVGGILALLSGLQAEERIAHGSAVHEVMERHEKLAFVTLGIFAALALWRLFRESRMGGGERLASLVVSLMGVGVLVATGREGARLVFEHAAGIPSKVLQAELKSRGASHHHAGGAGDADHERADSAGMPPHEHEEGEGAHSHAGDSAHSHAGDSAAHRP